jgi:hypothetical protein
MMYIHKCAVRESLQEIWEWVDADRNGVLDLEEYTRMFTVLFPFLNPDRLQNITAEEIEALAEKEYDLDTGPNGIQKQQFRHAFFQLADRWTEEIDVKLYRRFLKTVLLILHANPTPYQRLWRCLKKYVGERKRAAAARAAKAAIAAAATAQVVLVRAIFDSYAADRCEGLEMPQEFMNRLSKRARVS